MTDRDALAALVHGAVRMQDRGLLEGVDIQRIAWAATDAILAAGWRAPLVEHEHRWEDVRDLVTGADICVICGTWKDDA